MRKDDSVVSKLVNSAMTFIWLWEFARNEGLLSLEEAAESDRIKDLVLGNELPGIMMLIVDGTYPEIKEISGHGVIDLVLGRKEGEI